MNAFSNYLETSVLNHVLRGFTYTKPGSFWLALFTANPGDGGVDNEVTGGGYARMEVVNSKENFPQCEPGGVPTKTNGESVLFPTASASWGTVTHWAMYDAPATAPTVTGTTSNGSATITGIASTAALRVGMSVSGAGIPANSVIKTITSTTIVITSPDPTVSDNATASATVTITVTPKMILHGKLNVKRFVKSGKTLKIKSETLQLTLPQGPVGGFTDYVQRKVLDHIFGHLTYTTPGTVYAGVGTAMAVNSLTVPDSIEEWTDGSYSRQIVDFAAPDQGAVSNSTDMLFTAVDGVVDGAVTLACAGVWDDESAGNLLVVSNLRRSITLADENLFKILAGAFTVTLQ